MVTVRYKGYGKGNNILNGFKKTNILGIAIDLVILKFRVQGTLGIQIKHDRKLCFQ